MGAKTIVLTKSQLLDALDDSKLVEVSAWRHGRKETRVFWRDLKNYQVTVYVRPEEGLQVYDEGTACERVYPITTLRRAWTTDPDMAGDDERPILEMLETCRAIAADGRDGSVTAALLAARLLTAIGVFERSMPALFAKREP